MSSTQIIILLVAIAMFVVGFMLVYGNLKKVNLIESEKFNLEDWGTCVLFFSYSLELMNLRLQY